MSKHIYSNDLVSRHYVEFQTAETFRGKNLHYVTLSGVALANVKGLTSGNWYRDKLLIHIPFPWQQIPGVGPRPSGHFWYLLSDGSISIFIDTERGNKWQMVRNFVLKFVTPHVHGPVHGK